MPPEEIQRIPPLPAILELSFATNPWSNVRSLARPIEDVDFLYRVAAATYGTSLVRRRAPTWPLPRPTIGVLRYGSPLEFTLAVDLQTVLFGAGFGTGVVGLGGLLKWCFGLDLDFRIRRAEGLAELARLEADRLEDENRKLHAVAERRRLSADSSDGWEALPARPLPFDPAPPGPVDSALTRPAVNELVSMQAHRVAWIVHTELARGADNPSAGLTRRLLQVAKRGHHEPLPRSATLRDVTQDEAETLRLPQDGSAPARPDLRREYHD